MSGNVIRTADKLLYVFNKANELFFSSGLEAPEITIQSAGRSKMTFGWCSTSPIWRTKKNNHGLYEINICPEYFTRPFHEVITTLLHEMAHLYNFQNNIKDCTVNQYHNKKFIYAAEKAGLMVEKTERRGFSKTTARPGTLKWIESLGLDEKYFSTYRAGGVDLEEDPEADPEGEPEVKKKKGSKLKKWSCACTNIRCATKLNALCKNCGKPFEKQESEGEE